MIPPKLYGNCALPQNLHTRKLGEISVFYAVRLYWIWSITLRLFKLHHCVKIVRIRSYFGPHFPAFGLNTERYRVSLRIQSKCDKMRTGIILNTDTFRAVHIDTKIQNLKFVSCQIHQTLKVFPCFKFIKILHVSKLETYVESPRNQIKSSKYIVQGLIVPMFRLKSSII